MNKINLFLICMSSMLCLNSCTISFQNISTHGTATDLVDQEQGAKADVKPTVTIPATSPI